MKNLKRLGAFAIDFTIAFVVLNIFLFSYKVFMLDPQTMHQANYMLACAIIAMGILFVYMPTKNEGMTIGKMIVHLRVVNVNGKKRTWFQSFLREGVCKFSFVTFLIPLNIIFSLIESVKQRKVTLVFAHDELLRTTVE